MTVAIGDCRSDIWKRFEVKLPNDLLRTIKDLDASDRVESGPEMDGKFEDVDISHLAYTISDYLNSKNPSEKFIANRKFIHFFKSIRGLHDYKVGLSSEGNTTIHVLENAMFEGMLAFLEGRVPNFDSVAGFADKFIAIEFIGICNSGPENGERQAWVDYWKSNLAGCWPDVFIFTHRLGCEFPGRRW